MFRTTRVFRRACAQANFRRALHEDSSRGDYLGFSAASPPDPRFGMDMTRAPGYEIAAEEPPLVGNQKLVDFATRHARLSLSQIGQAEGYMWVGSVLYPTNMHPDYDIEAPWERGMEDDTVVIDLDKAVESEDKSPEKQVVEPVEKHGGKKGEEGMRADRRYTGGQARRIRKERERNAQRKAMRRLRKRTFPVRKPENDIPDDVDS